MRNLSEVLAWAGEKKVAIGHFNVSESSAFGAIAQAARTVGVPVLIGISEGERKFMGAGAAVALVRWARETWGQEIYLNSDHTHSVEDAVECARLGFDQVLFDASKLPLEENIAATRDAVRRIREVNPNVVIEGELGYIGSSSEIIDKVPEESLHLTTPEDALRFLKETGVDVVSPAVGNMHGMLADMAQGKSFKRLSIETIQQIADTVRVPLTLHGGSKTADEDFVAAIAAGVRIIHINSEIRLAWRDGVAKALGENPNEIAPYKLLGEGSDSIRQIVEARLRLFTGAR